LPRAQIAWLDQYDGTAKLDHEAMQRLRQITDAVAPDVALWQRSTRVAG